MLTDDEIEALLRKTRTEGYPSDLRALVHAVQAAERERWRRIATNAQAVTTRCADRLDYFEVPSHLMAALALALDAGPNAKLSGPNGPQEKQR